MRPPLSFTVRLLSVLIASAGLADTAHADTRLDMSFYICPLTRLVHVVYTVPDTSPVEIAVLAEVRDDEHPDWSAASVHKTFSATADRMYPEDVWNAGMDGGRLTEYNAAGLERKLLWYPYPDYERDGMIDADIRLTLTADGVTLASGEIHITADNSDVVYLDDWEDAVLQKDYLSSDMDGDVSRWWHNTSLSGTHAPSNGTMLDVREKGVPLPQLTCPLDLHGTFAIWVSMPETLSTVKLRLSGDEYPQSFSSSRFNRLQFWKHAPMDHQNIIVMQPHQTIAEYEDILRARLDHIKLVPLPERVASYLSGRSEGLRDRIVIGYNEPYSWAFRENIQSTVQHREALVPFREAGLDYVDIQIARLGMRPVFETRNEEPLYWNTMGDPVRGTVPRTSNVGRMQQYTNTLQTELRYCRELGMTPVANLGAGNAYPGSPLQGEFSKEHPDWHNGAQMRYDIPEVRQHMLAFYREALEIGAEAVSIDYCRYPDGQMNAETCTSFLRELRALTVEWSRKRGTWIPVSVRFPAQGVRNWEWFDYHSWCREGLVDFLCPSNIQGRHLNFDVVPYVEAARGSDVKVCPVVDALGWGLSWPGEFLQRVSNVYDSGADGIYIYQCDAAVRGGCPSREMVRIAGSTAALDRFFASRSRALPRESKDIYLRPPIREDAGNAYHPWERARIWTDGIEHGAVEVLLDGTLINTFTGPPYWVGSEDADGDALLEGDHEVTIRARDGDGWLVRTFTVSGVR